MTRIEILYSVIVLCGVVFVFCCWVAARNLSNRSRHVRIEVDVPVFRTDETVEIHPSVKGLYPTPEPQTLPFGVVDWRQRDAIRSEIT